MYLFIIYDEKKEEETKSIWVTAKRILDNKSNRFIIASETFRIAGSISKDRHFSLMNGKKNELTKEEKKQQLDNYV